MKDPVPLGSISSDGVAIAGHGGVLFVVGGSNEVIAQYDRSEESRFRAKAVAAAWHSTFLTRAEHLTAQGSRYIQIVLPEKQTVRPDIFPVALQTPTPLLAEIEKFSSERWYISTREILAAAEVDGSTFRPLDSHLSTHGAAAIAQALCKWLDLTMPPLPKLQIYHRPTDLMSKFCQSDPLEPCLEAVQWDNIADPVKAYAYEPPEMQIGKRVIYKSGFAPNRCKVICFGNSFFDLGYASNQISWWLSRLCTEFHFIWSREVDLEYTNCEQPDIVIAQTIERFLPSVPGI